MGCTTGVLCAAVLIKMTTSGGFTGLGTGGQPLELELGALQDQQREAVCSLVDRLPAAASQETMVSDDITYRFEVIDDDGTKSVHEVAESVLLDEELDLIDRLKE